MCLRVVLGLPVPSTTNHFYLRFRQYTQKTDIFNTVRNRNNCGIADTFSTFETIVFLKHAQECLKASVQGRGMCLPQPEVRLSSSQKRAARVSPASTSDPPPPPPLLGTTFLDCLQNQFNPITTAKVTDHIFCILYLCIPHVVFYVICWFIVFYYVTK